MSMMKKTLVTSAAVLASRVLGLVREIVFSSLFGASAALDAFVTAFRLPNLLRDLFAEGAMSQAFTSELSKRKHLEGDGSAWVLARRMGSQLLVLMSVITILGMILAGPVMQFMYEPAPGLAESAVELAQRQENAGFAAHLNRIMWPFIAFASLSAMAMGALNTFGRFGLPMLASALFNVVSVLVGLAIGYWIDPAFGPGALVGFAWGVTFGGLAQLAVQWPQLRKVGMDWKWDFNWKDAGIGRIWKMMVPSLAAAGATQINVFVNTGFALELEQGSVVMLANAFRLWLLPVGLFGVATGVMVLPELARLVAAGRRDQVATNVALALRQILFFALPSAIVLCLLGETVVSVIYQHGRFTADAVTTTAQILSAYSVGLLAFACIKVTQPAFIALEKRKVQLVVALLSIALNYGLNYLFVRVFHLDCVWLAITTSVLTTVNFAIYYVWLGLELKAFALRDLVPGGVRILAAGGVMAVTAWVAREFFLSGFVGWTFMERLVGMVLATGVAGGVYLACCVALRVPEVQALRRRLTRRSGGI